MLKLLPSSFSVTFLSTLSLRRATNARPEIRQLYAISIHALLAESDRIDPDQVPGYAISIHALLAESDGPDCQGAGTGKNFYPRSPCGERHPAPVARGPHADISIHALLAESDLDDGITLIPHQQFLSTLSLRRATLELALELKSLAISIHALLAESDCTGALILYVPTDFYPRSPCGERLGRSWFSPINSSFLSTLSLRRATLQYCQIVNSPRFLSTLSLRRATDILLQPALAF